MSIITLLKFLLGDRGAILTIAQSPRAIGVGFLFVVSAGLAREYDHESLLHEPWHALIPLGASLITSAALFLVLYAMPNRAETQRPRVTTAYHSFLSLYWMTAPLAWLYAVPYERMLDAADSTAANLWTLAVVAAWRVALMTRIISVLLNIRIVFGFMIVMAFADALVLTALSIADLPLINVMGGVSLTQSERLLADVALTVITLGLLSSGIWALGALAAFFMARPDWSFILSSPLPESTQHPPIGCMRCTLRNLTIVLARLHSQP